MIYVAFGQLAVIALLVYVLLRERESQTAMLEESSRRGVSERRELLNRIAQPGAIVPSPAARQLARKPRDPNYGQIGTILPDKEPA